MVMQTTDLDQKLASIEARYDELNTIMAQPETLGDPALVQRYGREYSSMVDVVAAYKALKEVRRQIAETEEMLNDGPDEEMHQLAYDEQTQLRERESGADARHPGGVAAEGHDGRARRHRDGAGGHGRRGGGPLRGGPRPHVYALRRHEAVDVGGAGLE